MNTFLRIAALVLVALGFVITFEFLLAVHNDGWTYSTSHVSYDFTNKVAGTIGSLVGPLISGAGFFFLYLNFREQKETLHRNRLESKFFQMVGYHRANINEITFTLCEKHGEPLVTAEKRKVFKVINKHFEELYSEVSFLFEGINEGDLYEANYKNKLNQNFIITERHINLMDFAKLDLLYLIIFFGAGTDGCKTIKKLTKDKYIEPFVDQLVTYAALKPKREFKYWHSWVTMNECAPFDKAFTFSDIIAKRKDALSAGRRSETDNNSFDDYLIYHPNAYDKYYGGHQFRLGHYFRNIYQAIKCIHEDKILSHQEKYDYIKVLRAQLSTAEQVILFLNSASQLGRSWEFEKKTKPDTGVALKHQLITVYNMIQNVPDREIIDNIEYVSFYPLVAYGVFYDNTVKENRKALRKLF